MRPSIDRDAYILGFANGRREAMTVTYHLALYVERKHKAAGDDKAAELAKELAALIQDLNNQFLPILPHTRLAQTYKPRPTE
jgi:hypothetical protein